MLVKKSFIGFILAAFLMTASLSAAETIAVLLKVRGTVSVTRGNQAKAVKARKGFRLQNGDKLVTGKRSFAALRFIDDKSLVRIRANSRCTINGKKQGKSQILKNVFVEVGTIFARVTRQRSSFKVSTPTSVASVKGTAFFTDQKLKGGTFYFGTEGVVEVTSDAGTALMRSGETAYVASKNSPPTVRKTKPGELPEFGEDKGGADQFELEFENEDGQKKILKFKAEKQK